MARCAGDKTMNTEYPHTDQRVAICYQQWADRHKKSAISALAEFRAVLRRAGDLLGVR